MYFLNFLDRNAMINGKLNDLDTDLGLKGNQYNTCVSILFVGYLCGQVPSNMILNRVRPSYYMAGKLLDIQRAEILLTGAISRFHDGLVYCESIDLQVP